MSARRDWPRSVGIGRTGAQRGEADAHFLEAARDGEHVDRRAQAIGLFGAVGAGEAGGVEQVIDRSGDDRIDAGIGKAGRDEIDVGGQRVAEVGRGAEGAIGQARIAQGTKNPDDQQPGEGMCPANRSDRVRTHHRPVG